MTPRPASRPTLLALTLGHGCADLCNSALWALLPFLVVERHYSYAAVGVFALAGSIASAVMQPLAGAHGDRAEGRWLLPAGLVLAGLGIAAVGLTAWYPLTLLAAVVCSVGVAAYHPEGARWARHASGTRVTANMGVFSVGGGVGYALAPLVVAAVLAPLGLSGTVVLALIPFAAATAVVVAVRRFRQEAQRSDRPIVRPTGASEWGPFACLVAMFCMGSGVFSGLFAFLPLFLIEARSTSPGTSNVMSSILLAAAAAGTVLGAAAAQRIGRRIMLIVPQLLLVPAIAVLPSLSYAGMIPIVVFIGIAMNTNVPIVLVLAQEYLPSRMGLATGLTIGLCAGAGGLIVAGLGVLGDATSLAPVLYAVALMPLGVAAFAAFLPRPAAAPPGTVWSLRATGEA